MGYAFISYSTKNQQMADSFKSLFNQNGIETWMAPGDIPFGSTYTSTINRAIKGASCFVLLLSESAQGSQWVLKETERAVSTGKTIFTVMLDDVPLNDDFEFMLSTSQAVAIRKINKDDSNIKRLLQAVITYTGKQNVEKNFFETNNNPINETQSKTEIFNYIQQKGFFQKLSNDTRNKNASDLKDEKIDIDFTKNNKNHTLRKDESEPVSSVFGRCHPEELIRKRIDGRYEINEMIGDNSSIYIYKAYDSIDNNTVKVYVFDDNYLEEWKKKKLSKRQINIEILQLFPKVKFNTKNLVIGDRSAYIVCPYDETVEIF